MQKFDLPAAEPIQFLRVEYFRLYWLFLPPFSLSPRLSFPFSLSPICTATSSLGNSIQKKRRDERPVKQALNRRALLALPRTWK